MLAATVTSIITLWAWPSAAMISATVSANASARRAAPATRAPRAASRLAKDRPSPLEPPVTSTCAPSIPNRSLIANPSQSGNQSLPHPVPDQNRSAHGAIQIALVGGGRDRQRVALQHEVLDLIGPGPCLVPRRIDVMHHDVVAQRKRAGVGDHGAEQLPPLFVRGHHVAGRYAIVSREDGVHPAVGRISDISVGLFAELVVPLTVGQTFTDIAAQFPGSDGGAVGRRLARLYGCQDFLLGDHITLLSAADESASSPVHPKYRKHSDIKEHRLPVALEMDIEGVDDGAVTLGPCSDQALASLRLLDDVQDRILRVRRFLVAKIHAGGEADIDAARGQPEIDMRRHRLAALAAGHASRLDGANRIKPGVEVGAGPGPAAKALIERLVLLVGRVVVAAGSIGLPCLHQDVLGDMTGAIEDSSLNDDPLTFDVGTGDIAAEIIPEDFKAGLARNQADMHIGTRGLRRGFGKV